MTAGGASGLKPQAGDVHSAFNSLRAASGRTDPAGRQSDLAELSNALRDAAEDFVSAIDADFGGRPRTETMLSEVGMVLENIRWTSRRVRRWMRPERPMLSPEFWPSRGRYERVPLGVVGILSPWNYPVQLALLPLVAALAAGNRVILRPSEFTPRTSELLRKVVEDAVQERVRVVLGGSEVAEALTRLPLDGLFFTGSVGTGRQVMAAAAENLTPVTLELGGKCPAILLPDVDLDRAADSIMAGKLLNAGQTCVAPDYLLVPETLVGELVEALKRSVARLYPEPERRDYAAIARPADRERLTSLLEGTDPVPLMERMPSPPRFGAWAVVAPDLNGPLMEKEIFGPILPIVPYGHPAEAAVFVNARPTPLALYIYGRRLRDCEQMVAATRSGGAMINDCVLQVAAHPLPFGGAGQSGMGSYHGEEGFRTFTRPRSVVVRSRFAPIGLSRPPYGTTVDRIIRFLLR
jgi:coniferyl-aldehyde dehydrogenase